MPDEAHGAEPDDYQPVGLDHRAALVGRGQLEEENGCDDEQPEDDAGHGVMLWSRGTNSNPHTVHSNKSLLSYCECLAFLAI